MRDTANRLNRKIVLSEGEDPRVIDAAVQARQRRIAEVVLVGDNERIRLLWVMRTALVWLALKFMIQQKSELLEEMAYAYHMLIR